MPRISNDNPRHRTKDEICEDIAFVLNSRLRYGTQFAVLSEAMWVWTEFDGKYKGCEHWSVEVWKIQDQQKMLVHEHMVPKSLVIKRLKELENPTKESVKELLDFYCKAAVVTRDEDRRLNEEGLRSNMPIGWDEKDVLARYALVGIVLRTPTKE